MGDAMAVIAAPKHSRLEAASLEEEVGSFVLARIGSNRFVMIHI